MIGDDLENDVGGAQSAGIRGVLVRTGKFDPDRLADTPPNWAPHDVVDSIRDVPALLT